MVQKTPELIDQLHNIANLMEACLSDEVWLGFSLALLTTDERDFLELLLTRVANRVESIPGDPEDELQLS